MSYWVVPVCPCFHGTIPNPLLGGVGGWGLWLIMVMAIVEKVWLHETRGHHHLIPHPTQRLLASHPTYSLLGFSAALAPKFTH